MWLTVARLRRVIKRDFVIQFGREQLTSYGGLELLRRFWGLIGLQARIQCALAAQPLGGDYGASHLVLVIGLLAVGARRLPAPWKRRLTPLPRSAKNSSPRSSSIWRPSWPTRIRLSPRSRPSMCN